MWQRLVVVLSLIVLVGCSGGQRRADPTASHPAVASSRHAGSAAPTTRAPTVQPCPAAGLRAPAIVSCLTADIQSFWHREGWVGLDLRVVVVTRPAQLPADCRSGWTNLGTAFFCDISIYLLAPYVAELTRTFGPLLQYALAATLGHEAGHTVGRYTGNPSSPQIEQMADCLDGVWAHDAAGRGRIDAPTLTAVAGRDLALLDRTVRSERAVHGPVAQRMVAFGRGLRTGDQNSCRVTGR